MRVVQREFNNRVSNIFIGAGLVTVIGIDLLLKRRDVTFPHELTMPVNVSRDTPLILAALLTLPSCSAGSSTTDSTGHRQAIANIQASKGQKLYEAAMALQIPCVNAHSGNLAVQDINAARKGVEQLKTRLEDEIDDSA